MNQASFERETFQDNRIWNSRRKKTYQAVTKYFEATKPI